MNTTLLIHGSFTDNIIDKIAANLNNFKGNINKVVYVRYKGEDKLYDGKIEKLFNGYNLQIVEIKDLINPGFANINRQIVSFNSALAQISDDDFVIKLRNDQSIDFNKLFSMIKKSGIDFMNQKKIITTNCYTRKDRLYHPSDMFICAKASLLKEYYNVPLSEDTELEVKMQIRERMDSGERLEYNPFSPESYLFRNFLKQNSWSIQETSEDSVCALNKYIYLLNSWDIDYRWKKARVFPFKKENALILPHYFRLRPFEYAPIENAQCFARHELIHEKPSLTDRYYILLSKYTWYRWKENADSYRNRLKKLKNKLRKIRREIYKALPYCLVYEKIYRLNEKILRSRHES